MKTKIEVALAKMEDWMRLKHRDHKTRAAYRREVGRFAQWLRRRAELHALSSERKVEAYLTMRAKEGCAASTQNVAFHALRCFYARGLEQPLDGVDALRAQRPPTIRRAPSMDEVLAILPAIPDLYGYPCRLVLEWIYGSGLRVSEAVSLRLGNVDFVNRCLTLKGAAPTVIPFPLTSTHAHPKILPARA